MRTFYMLEASNGKGFMPVTKSNRGYTYQEPTNLGVPRLFKTRRGAEMAAHTWARGKQSVIYDKYNGDFDISTQPTPDRHHTDWIVKEVII